MTKLLVFGGYGPLGAACIHHFKFKNWWVANMDHEKNHEADINIVIPHNNSWIEREKYADVSLSNALNNNKLNAILCLSDGWAGGNAEKDLCKQADFTFKHTVWSSTIAAGLATRHLAPGGLLCLTGSYFALDATPNMISYGMAKAAVHHLTKSLGKVGSGLPLDTSVVTILPRVLDTELNRRLAERSQLEMLTPLSYVVKLLEQWIKGENRPVPGSLITILTDKKETTVTCADEAYNLNPILYEKTLTPKEPTTV